MPTTFALRTTIPVCSNARQVAIGNGTRRICVEKGQVKLSRGQDTSFGRSAREVSIFELVVMLFLMYLYQVIGMLVVKHSDEEEDQFPLQPDEAQCLGEKSWMRKGVG